MRNVRQQKYRVYNPGKSRTKNVGELVTITIPDRVKNGGKKGMAKTRRGRKTTAHRGRSSNAGAKSRVKYVYRNKPAKRRKSNTGRRYRNTGVFAGTTGQVLGGAVGMTTVAMASSMLPLQMRTGVTGLFARGAVSFVQGEIAKKVTKSNDFGNAMFVGGLIMTAFMAAAEFMPSLAASLPVRSGMGAIVAAQRGQNVLPGAYSPTNFLQPIGPNVTQSAAPAQNGMGMVRRAGRYGRM